MNQFVYLFVVISNFFLCANAFTNTDSLNIRRTSLLINRERYTTELLMSSDGTLSRKNFFEKTLSLSFFSAAASFGGSSPAHAKSKGEPVTKDSIKAAFQAVRDQLESPDGGVNRLRAMIEKEDFEEIMEFTKYYDLEFRKAKIVKARRLLTSKEVKERGVYTCPTVLHLI
uniref:RxLR effector protein n=1 Tax=Chaetoceros debilis TaxID=122233 RepID=A0A7S3V914_9STRA|mmetsp:Transcript_17931/g.26325  ORF Transcript_17931/g.26325 Transcript_17931/m.26325 type:complete len:171 (-) Transcript_17931:225-737(-)